MRLTLFARSFSLMEQLLAGCAGCIGGHFKSTFIADDFALIVLNVFCIAAENTGGLILFQDYGFAVNVDLQGILLLNAQSAS